MQIFAVMMVRNEADVLRANVLHHLALGVDAFLILDNGSSDGTGRVLEELARGGRVLFTRDDGPYRQAEITTDLAREAYLRGADWILPIDADELWHVERGSLREILARTTAGALGVELLSFVQRRQQTRAEHDALLHMTRRPPAPTGTPDEARRLVSRRRIGFVEIAYPPKWISRASPILEIAMGNHHVDGIDGPRERTGDVVCFHAPLRARSVLEARITDHGRRAREIELEGDAWWQACRWGELGADELDAEWAANSYDGDHLDVGGERRPLVVDTRLRDLVQPWIENPQATPPETPVPRLAVDPARLRAGVGALREAVAQREETIARLHEEIGRHEHDVRALRASWSWRLTAPLRAVLDGLLALRKPGTGPPAPQTPGTSPPGLSPSPPLGRVRFGHLRRVVPLSDFFGFDRGLPVDRYYIESFLDRHALTVRGRVLEIGDDVYTRKLGGERVEHSDVLHVHEGNPKATLVADLTHAGHLPSDAFDCIILTQTLHYIYDFHSAVRTLHRILRPGGVLLVTVPGISQISTDEWGAQWYWSFTRLSLRRALVENFPDEAVTVETYGNVLASIAFLHGLACEELTRDELEAHDPCYQLVVAARATKPVSEREKPLVSVIVPCYNQARFLGEAIASVLAQSHPEVEIVVVDDGSDDDTAAVAESFAGVRLVRQENQGLAAARNTGVRRSRGRFLVFLDADDRLLPEAVAIGLRELERCPERAAVAGHHRHIDVRGETLAEWPGLVVEDGHYFGLLQGNFIAAIHAVIFRRELFDEVAGFDTTLGAAEDYDLLLRVTRRFPIYCHDVEVAEYRQHQDNMTRDSALLLRSTLRVLAGQWSHVRASKALRQAYRAGTRFWRNYYGSDLAVDIRARFEAGRFREARRGLATLWRYHPYGAVLLLAGRGGPRKPEIPTPESR